MMVCACRVGKARCTYAGSATVHAPQRLVCLCQCYSSHVTPTGLTTLTACAHDLYLLFALGREVWVVWPTSLRAP